MLLDDDCNVDIELADEFWGNFGYTNELLSDYGKCYLGELLSHIKDETGDQLNISFKAIESPKFYNFSTDRLFAYIDQQTVLKIYQETDKTILKRIIRERFSDRSGFISFYPNTLEKWPENPERWDHNQLETLFMAWIETKDIYMPSEYELMECLFGNGIFEDMVYKNMPPGCKAIVDKCYEKYHAA